MGRFELQKVKNDNWFILLKTAGRETSISKICITAWNIGGTFKSKPNPNPISLDAWCNARGTFQGNTNRKLIVHRSKLSQILIIVLTKFELSVRWSFSRTSEFLPLYWTLSRNTETKEFARPTSHPVRGWTGKNKAFCSLGTQNGRRVIKVYCMFQKTNLITCFF